MTKKDGSSPRLWGTRIKLVQGSWKRRFIPTPVGNTLITSRGPVSVSVHPHACGEHQNGTKTTIVFIGSSPRLWGTLMDHKIPPYSNRFIPTPVGNTMVQQRRKRR